VGNSEDGTSIFSSFDSLHRSVIRADAL